jgi:hypothetical protein
MPDDLGDAHVRDILGAHDADLAGEFHLAAAEPGERHIRQFAPKLRDDLRAVVVAGGLASGEKQVRIG